MRISFVVPAYNEEKGVAASLQAILKEIERTEADAEVVLVNNASTDRTRKIAAAIAGVRVVDENNKGLVRARAAGYAATTGELVANIDSDTLLPEGWLTTVLRAFERDQSLVALSGPYIYYDLSAWKRFCVRVFYFFGYLSHLVQQHVLHGGAMLQGGNFVIKRSAWDKAGGYDTSIEFYGEDTDVAKRLISQGLVKWTWSLPALSSGRRIEKEGILRTGLRYALNYFSVSFRKKPATQSYIDVRS